MLTPGMRPHVAEFAAWMTARAKEFKLREQARAFGGMPPACDLETLESFWKYLVQAVLQESVLPGMRFKLGNTEFEVQATGVEVTGKDGKKSANGVSAKSAEGWGILVNVEDALAFEWLERETPERSKVEKKSSCERYSGSICIRKVIGE